VLVPTYGSRGRELGEVGQEAQVSGAYPLRRTSLNRDLRSGGSLPFDGQVTAAGAKVEAAAEKQAAVDKLLPEDVRKAWERAFVAFACDELNGLYDRLAAAAQEKKPCPPDIRRRIQSIVQALSWSRDAVVDQVWTLIDEGLERPEDAFAFAIVLTGLLPNDPKVQQWMSGQPVAIAPVIAHAMR